MQTGVNFSLQQRMNLLTRKKQTRNSNGTPFVRLAELMLLEIDDFCFAHKN